MRGRFWPQTTADPVSYTHLDVYKRQALPFPASILMLTAGGFVAAGDLDLLTTFAAAAIGAIAGDQVGFWAGRRLGAPLLARLGRDPARDLSLIHI